MKSKAAGCGSISAVISSVVLLCVISIIKIIIIIIVIVSNKNTVQMSKKITTQKTVT